MLIGQVNPAEDGPGSPVALVTAGTSFLVAQTKADERAIFTLDAPAGRYDLFLGLPDGVIMLPGLDLGGARQTSSKPTSGSPAQIIFPISYSSGIFAADPP